MTKDLIDGHFGISFGDSIIRLEKELYDKGVYPDRLLISDIIPTQTKVFARPGRPSNREDLVFAASDRKGAPGKEAFETYNFMKTIAPYWNGPVVPGADVNNSIISLDVDGNQIGIRPALGHKPPPPP
jgi:hypothetical protein